LFHVLHVRLDLSLEWHSSLVGMVFSRGDAIGRSTPSSPVSRWVAGEARKSWYRSSDVATSGSVGKLRLGEHQRKEFEN
jgi:hypothetical protein